MDVASVVSLFAAQGSNEKTVAALRELSKNMRDSTNALGTTGGHMRARQALLEPFIGNAEIPSQHVGKLLQAHIPVCYMSMGSITWRFRCAGYDVFFQEMPPNKCELTFIKSHLVYDSWAPMRQVARPRAREAFTLLKDMADALAMAMSFCVIANDIYYDVIRETEYVWTWKDRITGHFICSFSDGEDELNVSCDRRVARSYRHHYEKGSRPPDFPMIHTVPRRFFTVMNDEDDDGTSGVHLLSDKKTLMASIHKDLTGIFKSIGIPY